MREEKRPRIGTANTPAAAGEQTADPCNRPGQRQGESADVQSLSGGKGKKPAEKRHRQKSQDDSAGGG